MNRTGRCKIKPVRDISMRHIGFIIKTGLKSTASANQELHIRCTPKGFMSGLDL